MQTRRPEQCLIVMTKRKPIGLPRSGSLNNAITRLEAYSVGERASEIVELQNLRPESDISTSFGAAAGISFSPPPKLKSSDVHVLLAGKDGNLDLHI
jgi:hypothetical protein